MQHKIQIVEYKPLNLSGYTIIEGFPGMGLVGRIAAKFLAEKLHFEQVGHIHSDIFVPLIRIHEGIPLHPSRIYARHDLKIVVLISEQIIPRELTHIFGEAIIEWIKSKSIRRVISLAGINSGNPKDKTIYGIASNSASLKILNEHKISVIKEGITTGVTALMMLELSDEKLEAISIMGSVAVGADYKAAAALLEKLDEMLALNIDTEPLLKEALETEKELLKQFEQMRESHETVQKLEDQSPRMYA